MERIIPLLKNGNPIVITTGPDDLCDVCLNKIDIDGLAACKSQEKVLRYDQAVLDNCKLQEGQVITWNGIYNVVTKAFFEVIKDGNTLFKETCSDCSWYDICNHFGRQN